MKSIVVYYSLTGNTDWTAEEIAKMTDSDLLRINPVKAYPDKGFKKFFWGGKSAVMQEKPKLEPYEFDADKYDAVIIGSPVWASNITPPVRSFISDNMEALKRKKISVFVCYSGGGAAKAIEKLNKLVRVENSLILTDPKDSPDSENLSRIREFCAEIQ